MPGDLEAGTCLCPTSATFMGLLPFDSCPSAGCVECKLLSRIDFLSRLGTRVLAAATAGQTFRIGFPGDFGGRNEGQNVLAATGPVDQRLVGLGSLRCSLASIANSMQRSKLWRRS